MMLVSEIISVKLYNRIDENQSELTYKEGMMVQFDIPPCYLAVGLRKRRQAVCIPAWIRTGHLTNESHKPQHARPSDNMTVYFSIEAHLKGGGMHPVAL
jgi:hypothetical protein